MVDWSKISAGLADRIKDIITSEGEDRETAKLDKHAEYQKLSQLLSGGGKVSGEEKGFVEGMLKDFEEAYLVRPEVRERVLDIIKHGEKMQADDKAEISELKKYAGTNGLTREEKKWIKDVVNGRVVKDLPTEENNGIAEVDESKITEQEQNKTVPNKTSENANVEPRSAENPEKPNEITNKKPANNKGDVAENPDRPLDIPNKKPNRGKGEPKPPVFGPTPMPVPMPTPLPVTPMPRTVDNDRVDDKDHVDNKGATQQGGMGNINVDHGTVIINNGIPVPVGPNGGGYGENVPNPDAPVDKGEKTDDTKPGKISVEEAREARKDGEAAGEALLGQTSNTEQRIVQDIINEEVNSGNVMEFFKGYEKELKEHNLWVGGLAKGDHFFEQIRTENNFPEQQDLMRKVAEDLQGYLANKYGVDSDVAREVSIVLLEGVLGKEQAKALDKIYQEELGMKKEAGNRVYTGPVTGAVQLGIDAVRKLTE